MLMHRDTKQFRLTFIVLRVTILDVIAKVRWKCCPLEAQSCNTGTSITCNTQARELCFGHFHDRQSCFDLPAQRPSVDDESLLVRSGLKGRSPSKAGLL